MVRLLKRFKFLGFSSGFNSTDHLMSQIHFKGDDTIKLLYEYFIKINNYNLR